jgi:hypothetical protein
VFCLLGLVVVVFVESPITFSVRIEFKRTRLVLLNFDVDLYLRNSPWPSKQDVLLFVPHRAQSNFEEETLEKENLNFRLYF